LHKIIENLDKNSDLKLDENTLLGGFNLGDMITADDINEKGELIAKNYEE